MSNSFNISVAPELAAISTLIKYNETKIDTIDTVVDAIKVKTDATPQKVRGSLQIASYSASSAGFVDIVNVNGQGSLLQIVLQSQTGGMEQEIIITLDGVDSETYTFTDQPGAFFILPIITGAGSVVLQMRSLAVVQDNPNYCYLNFDTSLQIQLRRSAGAADLQWCTVYYLLDSF